jgi:diketogulonate reductase-like aldo/keto reductase
LPGPIADHPRFPDDLPTRRLADGLEMPVLGIGLWRVREAEAERALGWALEAGYRHVDTAQAYRNEAAVGRALASSGLPRDDVFVTTKFYPGARDPVVEAERSLERFGIDSVDLYLIHWPQAGPTWAWPGMERALERGLTRAIGVSNYDVEELAEVIAAADLRPAVNQIQLSPFHYRRELLRACERHGVLAEAYSPLTTGRHLGDPTVGRIAARVGRTPAQVMLRWGIERGFVVIPRSVHRERIVENSHVFDFSLAPEDLAALDALDRTGGTANAREQPWWTGGRFGAAGRRAIRRLVR